MRWATWRTGSPPTPSGPLSPADVKPGGAIDVSDEARFAELMAACPYSPRIFNNLSADRIHFSATGG